VKTHAHQPEGTLMHDDTDLLTIDEAAQLLRAPVATLRYWRHLGTGPRSLKIGRRVMYLHADLIVWINGQRGDAA
jgi:predicted DCC family thiol-disulfide oxidoreductase YuxK